MKALRVVAWFLGFGLLPFWGSLIYLARGADGPEDYFIPVLVAALTSATYCAMTLATAGATYAVYLVTGGRVPRKLKYAGTCFAFLAAAILLIVGAQWNRREAAQADLKAEQEAARVLVENSDLVARAAPARFQVGLVSSRVDSNKLPVRFTYAVYWLEKPIGSLIAIVDISRGAGGPEYTLKCVVPQGVYTSRDSRADPCESADVPIAQ
jgi:hypothetical protein